jgi:hypothetical protein
MRHELIARIFTGKASPAWLTEEEMSYLDRYEGIMRDAFAGHYKDAPEVVQTHQKDTRKCTYGGMLGPGPAKLPRPSMPKRKKKPKVKVKVKKPCTVNGNQVFPRFFKKYLPNHQGTKT